MAPPPDVAMITQNAGKKAKEKFEQSLMVEQQRLTQPVILTIRKIDIARLVTVEKVEASSLLFSSLLIDLKKDVRMMKQITISPVFTGASELFLITCHI